MIVVYIVKGGKIESVFSRREKIGEIGVVCHDRIDRRRDGIRYGRFGFSEQLDYLVVFERRFKHINRAVHAACLDVDDKIDLVHKLRIFGFEKRAVHIRLLRVGKKKVDGIFQRVFSFRKIAHKFQQRRHSVTVVARSVGFCKLAVTLYVSSRIIMRHQKHACFGFSVQTRQHVSYIVFAVYFVCLDQIRAHILYAVRGVFVARREIVAFTHVFLSDKAFRDVENILPHLLVRFVIGYGMRLVRNHLKVLEYVFGVVSCVVEGHLGRRDCQKADDDSQKGNQCQRQFFYHVLTSGCLIRKGIIKYFSSKCKRIERFIPNAVAV